jgi:hypothetical protein
MNIQPPSSSPPGSLVRLPDTDRYRLSEALQELLAHGSILGLEPGRSELYEWCRQNSEWLREGAALIGLIVYSEHESRLVQAIPQRPSLTLNLKQDATIVMLALWYEFDTQVREHGATQVLLTVRQLNEILKEKLLPDLRSQPSAGRLKEILVQGRRFNLIRVDFVEPFDGSRIEVLPTLKKVIQFNDVEEWTRTAELHRNPTIVTDPASTSTDEEGDETT